jgi:hypothetical protein
MENATPTIENASTESVDISREEYKRGEEAWANYLAARFANDKVPKNPYPKDSPSAHLWQHAFDKGMGKWFRE